jgi:hypothetical protein
MTPIQFMPLLCATLVCAQTYSAAPILQRFDRSFPATTTSAERDMVTNPGRSPTSPPASRTIERTLPGSPGDLTQVSGTAPGNAGVPTGKTAAALFQVPLTETAAAASAAPQAGQAAAVSEAQPEAEAAPAAAQPEAEAAGLTETLLSEEAEAGVAGVLLALADTAPNEVIGSALGAPARNATFPNPPQFVFRSPARRSASAPEQPPSLVALPEFQATEPQTPEGDDAEPEAELPAVPLPTSAAQLLVALAIGAFVASRRRADPARLRSA